MENHMNEKIVQNVKDCGQSLIDNAEELVANCKYLRGIKITCYPSGTDDPVHIEVVNDLYPENYIARQM